MIRILSHSCSLEHFLSFRPYFQNYVERTPILFSAYIASSREFKPDTYIDKFDGFKVYYDDSEFTSFDKDSGKFTTRINGVYEFSLSIPHNNVEGLAYIKVEKNDAKELQFISYEPSTDAFNTLSFTWYMELKKHDKIRLKVFKGHQSFYASSTANVIFSGKYLRQIRVNEPTAKSSSYIINEEDKDKFLESKLNQPIDQNNDNSYSQSQDEEETTTQRDELVAENPDVARILQRQEENINEAEIDNNEQ